MSPAARYLSAEAAAGALGVTLSTLYAYVSRGLIRSEPGTERSRARRYDAEDVRRLRERKERRRDPEGAARSALHLGAPVLESAITLIEDGRFHYRGEDAVGLARTRTLEEVASLVWSGGFGTAPVPPGGAPEPGGEFDPAHPAESFQRLLARAAVDDAAAFDLRPEAVVRTGFRILRTLAAAVSGAPPEPDAPVAEVLRRAWGVEREGGRALLDAALVLCVDHELNVSAFTARCAASAGATPYAAVIAGLSALAGARQSGGEVERVEALLDEVEGAGDAPAVLGSRLRRGEGVPGFGHPLYPDGDPRGAALLDLLREAVPGSPALARAEGVARAAWELVGERPVVDFGLVALARALGLPRRSALTLFAIGRSVGFVAHAIEQYAAGRVIRPRARYTGPPPRGPDGTAP